MEAWIPLSEVMDQLRIELKAARSFARDDELKFDVRGIQVELQVAVTKESEAGAEVKLWVLGVGAKGKRSNAHTQTITFDLVPELELPPAKPGDPPRTGKVKIAQEGGAPAGAPPKAARPKRGGAVKAAG